MAAFSSRGPAGNFIKPDVTAPGVQILAGHTPTPESIRRRPARASYFQAIAGTSMSSPHVAGAALLVRAAHPSWTPGQVKSALMTDRHHQRQEGRPHDAGRPVRLRVPAGSTSTAAAASPLDASTSRPPTSRPGRRPDSTRSTSTCRRSTRRSCRAASTTTRTVDERRPARRRRYEASTTSPAGIEDHGHADHVRAQGRRSRRPSRSPSNPTRRSASSSSARSRSSPRRARASRSAGGCTCPSRSSTPRATSASTQSCAPGTIKQGADDRLHGHGHEQRRRRRDRRPDDQDRRQAQIIERHAARRQQGSHKVTAVGQHRRRTAGRAVDRRRRARRLHPARSLRAPSPTPIGDEEILNFNVPAFLFNGVEYTRDRRRLQRLRRSPAAARAEDNNCCNLPRIRIRPGRTTSWRRSGPTSTAPERPGPCSPS